MTELVSGLELDKIVRGVVSVVDLLATSEQNRAIATVSRNSRTTPTVFASVRVGEPVNLNRGTPSQPSDVVPGPKVSMVTYTAASTRVNVSVQMDTLTS